MGVLLQNGNIVGGIDSSLIAKIGNTPLSTIAQDLSSAINELNSNKANIATTLSGYGITDAKIENGVITLGQDSIIPLTSHQDISGKVNKSGDTMTGTLTMAGQDILLGTSSSSSNDSADIVWNYGNGQEKSRIWTANTYSTSEKLGPNYRVYAEDGTSVLSGRLMVTTGDTMSGALTFNKVANAIYYTGTKASYPMIKFIDNTADVNGNGIAIGGGGATIIGGGESSSAMAGAVSTGGDEILYLGNDGNVNVFSNLQNGWASRKSFTFDTNGHFTVGSGYLISTCNGNTVSIGSQNSSWCHIYNTANIPFIFNKAVATTDGTLGTDQYRWGMGYFKNNLSIKFNGSPGIDCKASQVDALKTNNGITAGVQSSYVMSSNTTGYCGRFCTSYGTNGMIDAKIQVRNWKSDGSEAGTNWILAYESTAGAQTYSVGNAANFRSAIGAAASSSREIKENIHDLTEEEALKILDINPVSFKYKQGFDIDNKYRQEYGVIAEDTVDIIPSVVNIPTTEGWKFDPEGGMEQEFITVDYAKFVPFMIKLAQMQQTEINELKSELTILKNNNFGDK